MASPLMRSDSTRPLSDNELAAFGALQRGDTAAFLDLAQKVSRGR